MPNTLSRKIAMKTTTNNISLLIFDENYNKEFLSIVSYQIG
jgi:hypothetical protein